MPLGNTVEIEANNITCKEDIQPGHFIASHIKGYSSNANYHFTVEDTKTKVGIEQSSDSPISVFSVIHFTQQSPRKLSSTLMLLPERQDIGRSTTDSLLPPPSRSDKKHLTASPSIFRRHRCKNI
jgi:hypothetical protein